MTLESTLRGILLTVAYDGAGFHGYALQPSARTVAGELLGAIQAMDPKVREIRGVSRTDAGVHATGQLVAFDSSSSIPPRGWVLGLLAHLPDEVATRRAAIVPAGFDPRHHVAHKHYRYSLLLDQVRDPFLDRTCWRVGAALDLGLARQAAALVVGTHDFAAFRSSADERTSTTRTILSVEIARALHDPRLVTIDVRGTAFLHNMVRILAGTLVDVARGRLRPTCMTDALASGQRADLGITAPPQGLCLVSVTLDEAAGVCDHWPTIPLATEAP